MHKADMDGLRGVDRPASQHGRPPQSVHKRYPPKAVTARRVVRRLAERTHSLSGRHVTSRPPSTSASDDRSWLNARYEHLERPPTSRGSPRRRRRRAVPHHRDTQPPPSPQRRTGSGGVCPRADHHRPTAAVWRRETGARKQPPAVTVSRSPGSEAREENALPLLFMR